MILVAGSYLERPPTVGETRLPPGWRPPLRLKFVADRITDRPLELGDKINGSGLSVEDEQGILLRIFEGHPHLEPFGVIAGPVVGVRHRGAQLDPDEVAVGQPFSLARDQNNAHDRNAVGIWDSTEHQQLGWVPSDLTSVVAEVLDGGRPLDAWCIWEWRDSAGRRVGLCTLIAPDGLVHEPEV